VQGQSNATNDTADLALIHNDMSDGIVILIHRKDGFLDFLLGPRSIAFRELRNKLPPTKLSKLSSVK